MQREKREKRENSERRAGAGEEQGPPDTRKTSQNGSSDLDGLNMVPQATIISAPGRKTKTTAVH